MKKLQLSGKYSDIFIKLDDEDYKELRDYDFYLVNGKYKTSDGYYIHQLMFGNEFNYKIKFINGDTTDYRRSNLDIKKSEKKIIIKGTVGKVTKKITNVKQLREFFSIAKNIIEGY